MQSERQQKMNRELARILATFIERESNRSSLITVTRCDISPNFKNLIVYLSVLPEDKEDQVMSFMKRRAKDAREYVKKNLSMRVIPFIEFRIDAGEKNRQRITELLRKEFQEE
jgi:ribosome-binding factor A